MSAVKDLIKNEGGRAIFKGVVPNIYRCSLTMTLNMVTYEESKQRLSQSIYSKWTLWALSAINAATVSTLASLPFENAKVKL